MFGAILNYGQSCALSVRLLPYAEGKLNAQLRINTNEPSGVPYTVAVQAVVLTGGGMQLGKDIKQPSNANAGVKTAGPPAQPPDLRAILIDGELLTAILADGFTFRSTNGGREWVFGEPAPDAPQARRFGVNGLVANVLGRPINVYAEYLEGQHGWAVGKNGLLLRTFDGSKTWYPASVAAVAAVRGRSVTSSDGLYGRFIAPWYWLALLLCGAMLFPVLFPVEKVQQEASQSRQDARDPDQEKTVPPPATLDCTIGNQAVSDKPLEPGDPDALGLSSIAAGLSFFLRNEKTKPPLVIGINGRWGSGKSSLMNLLKGNLEDYGAHPVWFNAWHHQKEDQLLAALLEAVKAQAVPPISEFSGCIFRSRLAWKRLTRYWFYLALIIAGVYLVHRAELHLRSVGLSLSMMISFLTPVESVKEFFENASIPGPLTSLATIAAVMRVTSAGLKAFGSNPASLLASVSGNPSQ